MDPKLEDTATHLGDGAYVHKDGIGGIVFTANHHDPSYATDIVSLDERAVKQLISWLHQQGLS